MTQFLTTQINVPDMLYGSAMRGVACRNRLAWGFANKFRQQVEDELGLRLRVVTTRSRDNNLLRLQGLELGTDVCLLSQAMRQFVERALGAGGGEWARIFSKRCATLAA